jgi:hypothetical protein
MSIQELVFYELRDCASKVRKQKQNWLRSTLGFQFSVHAFGCSRNHARGEIMGSGY